MLLGLLMAGCNPKMGEVVIQPPQLANKEGTLSENEQISDGLERLSKSVYRLTVIAFYEVYTFEDGNQLQKKNLNEAILRQQSVTHKITNQTVLGTAIAIYDDGSKAGFLTCAHVVDFSDTLITYYPSEGKGKNHIIPIKSIAIKLRQQNFISELRGEQVTLVASDKKHDIAFLTMKIDPKQARPVLFPFSPGQTKSLNWGTKMYILGFPNGRKMVTSALYSKPSQMKSGFFMMDAIFNRGFSGAPVVVYIKQPPYFLWVGMASSVASKRFNFLEPVLDGPNEYSASEPFTGSAVVNNETIIKYGITFSISIEQIRKFVKENNALFSSAGIGSMEW